MTGQGTLREGLARCKAEKRARAGTRMSVVLEVGDVEFGMLLTSSFGVGSEG